MSDTQTENPASLFMPNWTSTAHLYLVFLFVSSWLVNDQAVAAKAKKANNEKTSAAHLFKETRYYVHDWIELPNIKGHDLNGRSVLQRPKPGVFDILIFVASWCVPCQQIIPKVKKLEKRFNRVNTRFTYVFSHDLKAEAIGFAEEYRISNALIASHEILKSYHNPDLPGIYMGDRNGWILTRFLRVRPEDFSEIEKKMVILTTY